jgi:hypothetical protein
MNKEKSFSVLAGAAVSLVIYTVAMVFSDPTPRPTAYTKVPISEAFHENGSVEVEGKVTNPILKPPTGFSLETLEFYLQDSTAPVECESSSGLIGRLYPLNKGNASVDDSVKMAYAVLMRKNPSDKVTVKGRMNGDRLEMYEFDINRDKFVLLER